VGILCIGKELQVPEGGFSISWLSEAALPICQAILTTFGEAVKERSPEGFLQVEERVFKLFAALGSCVVAALLAWLHSDREWVASCVAAARRRADVDLRNHGWRPTSVQLLGGIKLKLKTPYLSPERRGKPGRPRGVGSRGEGGNGVYPVLESLGVRHLASPATASQVAKQMVRAGSGAEAQEALAERGLDLDLKTVFRLTLQVGEDALAQRAARIEAANLGIRFSDEFAGKRVVISTDGGRLRLREGGKRGRRRKSGRRGYRTPWREPKLITAYVIDESGRKVRSERPLYDGSLGDADVAFELLTAELLLRGAADAELLVIAADGAPWIWNRAEDLRSALGLDADRLIRVADFYHAVEHLRDIAVLRTGWSDEEQATWVKRMRRKLKKSVAAVIEGAKKLCRGRKAKEIQKHVAYFENRVDQMQYAEFKANGIPCGSGAMESMVRRVVNLRLKGPAIFWRERMAEPMLHLRAYFKAGRWDELIRRVIHGTPDGAPDGAAWDSG